MNFLQRALTSERPSQADTKYHEAMRLASEVREMLRDTVEDPFTVVALDIAREVLREGADPALVADAYEANQEAKIYQGPPSS